MASRTALAPPRRCTEDIDRAALAHCRAALGGADEQRARRALLGLALTSEPYWERVEAGVHAAERISPGDSQDRSCLVAEHFTTRLQRALTGSRSRNPSFLLSRVNEGASFSGWIRTFLTGVMANVVSDVMRAERSRPDLLDPVCMAELNLVGAPTRVDTRWDDAEEEWRRRAPSLRGRSRTLQSARVLERVLSLKALNRVQLSESERDQVLEQSRDLRTVAEAVRRSARSEDSPLGRMLQRHTSDEIDDLLSQPPLVVGRLVEAAATPQPPLRQKVVHKMVSVLSLMEPSHPRILRAVVLAWAETAADLTCSEYRTDAVAQVKTPERCRADREAFAAAFERARAAGLTVFGMSLQECADRLQGMSNEVEQIVDEDVA